MLTPRVGLARGYVRGGEPLAALPDAIGRTRSRQSSHTGSASACASGSTMRSYIQSSSVVLSRPSGFEDFVRDVSELDEITPEALATTAAMRDIEILGPPGMLP
jgi:hypothetical protein